MGEWWAAMSGGLDGLCCNGGALTLRDRRGSMVVAAARRVLGLRGLNLLL